MFIKPTKRRSWAKECKNYLEYKIGKYYNGALSILAFGEMAKAIASIEKETEWISMGTREKVFTDLILILKKKDMQFWSPQFGCMKKALEIQQEFQFEPADTLHLACASEDRDCSMFVTIEEKFLNNPRLEKKLGIKVKHPSAL